MKRLLHRVGVDRSRTGRETTVQIAYGERAARLVEAAGGARSGRPCHVAALTGETSARPTRASRPRTPSRPRPRALPGWEPPPAAVQILRPGARAACAARCARLRHRSDMPARLPETARVSHGARPEFTPIRVWGKVLAQQPRNERCLAHLGVVALERPFVAGQLGANGPEVVEEPLRQSCSGESFPTSCAAVSVAEPRGSRDSKRAWCARDE